MVLLNTLGSQTNTVLLLYRYDRTVDACSLRADLKILPYGDQTEVGALSQTLNSLNCL